MALIRDIKEQIINKRVPPLLVFLCKKDTFLAQHYVTQISIQESKPLLFVDKPEDLNISSPYIRPQDKNTVVHVCDKLTSLNTNMVGYIICTELATCIDAKNFQEIICVMPQLEAWQLKDYLYSVCEGPDESQLDRLFNMFKDDPAQLDLEMNKLRWFSAEERKHFLPVFFEDGVFGTTSSKTIFTLTNALCTRDLQTVSDVLRELDHIDIEPVGLVTVLVTNFRNILLVQGSSNPSADRLGLTEKQFYAIRRNTGYYTTTQLIHVLKVLEDIDFRLKTGGLPVEWIISYVITTILSVS